MDLSRHSSTHIIYFISNIGEIGIYHEWRTFHLLHLNIISSWHDIKVFDFEILLQVEQVLLILLLMLLLMLQCYFVYVKRRDIYHLFQLLTSVQILINKRGIIKFN